MPVGIRPHSRSTTGETGIGDIFVSGIPLDDGGSVPSFKSIVFDSSWFSFAALHF
jgi:hypothetical protein